MKVLDLFSGIGGFSLGLERAGMETVAFCEIEEYPKSILKKHWPDVPIFNDIHEITGELIELTVGKVDVVCGGFPCQPFSVAGKQEGKEDNRYLWPQMLRIIKETRPSWVIGENVVGIVPMALDNVLSDLESEGYATQSFIIPACAVGAVHRRERVWIVANSELPICGGGGSNGDLCKQGRESTETERTVIQSEDRESYTDYTKSICDVISNSEHHGRDGCEEQRSDEEVRKKPNDKQSSRCSGSQPFRPIDPPAESPVCSRNDGVSQRVVRLKALGNAVVPQIPELIGRAIMEIERGEQ